jgi:hypothetical protein
LQLWFSIKAFEKKTCILSKQHADHLLAGMLATC